MVGSYAAGGVSRVVGAGQRNSELVVHIGKRDRFYAPLRAVPIFEISDAVAKALHALVKVAQFGELYFGDELVRKAVLGGYKAKPIVQVRSQKDDVISAAVA